MIVSRQLFNTCYCKRTLLQLFSVVVFLQTEFNRMRFITYPGTDVIIICFSVVRAASLDSVINRWLPELDVYCPLTVPVVLVGTQIDLRPATANGSDHRRRRGPATAADMVATVSYEQGARTAKKVGAHGYAECSALSGAGLVDVFVEATKAALNAAASRRRRRRSSSSSSSSSKSVLSDAASSLLCWRTTTV